MLDTRVVVLQNEKEIGRGLLIGVVPLGSSSVYGVVILDDGDGDLSIHELDNIKATVNWAGPTRWESPQKKEG